MSFLRDPKRLIATIVAGVAGLIVLIDFGSSLSAVDALALALINWAALLAALALLVGLLSVVASHVMRVVRRAPDWGYSLVLLLSMLVVIVSGTLAGVGFDADGEVSFITLPRTVIETPLQTLFAAIYQPLAASFLALLAFFSLSAALRALRRRTADALVIVVVALLVLVVAALPQIEGLPVLGQGIEWVRNHVVLAGARGLLLGTALGALIAGVRVLLGFDQPYLDR